MVVPRSAKFYTQWTVFLVKQVDVLVCLGGPNAQLGNTHVNSDFVAFRSFAICCGRDHSPFVVEDAG